MNLQQDKVAIRFIGRKAPFFDHLYGTKLTFEAGQVRAVPPHVAKQFLKHVDLFELVTGEAADIAEEPVQKQDQNPDSDDTDAILEKSSQEAEQKEEANSRLEDLRQRVMLCDNKDELIDMARTNWQQNLPKQKSVENLRRDVLQFLDQFGMS